MSKEQEEVFVLGKQIEDWALRVNAGITHGEFKAGTPGVSNRLDAALREVHPLIAKIAKYGKSSDSSVVRVVEDSVKLFQKISQVLGGTADYTWGVWWKNQTKSLNKGLNDVYQLAFILPSEAVGHGAASALKPTPEESREAAKGLGEGLGKKLVPVIAAIGILGLIVWYSKR